MEDMQDMQNYSAQQREESERKNPDFSSGCSRTDQDQGQHRKKHGLCVRGLPNIDEDFYEELEETLIMGDLGVAATERILDDLREKVKQQHIKEPMECRQLLIDSIKEQMDVGGSCLPL